MKKLAIDIGGYSIQYEFLENNNKGYFLTENLDKDKVLDKIASLINDNDIDIVGISTPCALNVDTGYLEGLSGIKNWFNFNLYDEIKKRVKNKKIIIKAINDANSSLVANLHNYPFQNAVAITIGTGIGGALYINNQLVTGKRGYAGDFGYAPYYEDGNIKNLSEVVSTHSLINYWYKGKYKNAKELFADKNFDKKIFNKWLEKLYLFIHSLFYVIEPEIIFISGGITNNEYFKQEFNKLNDNCNLLNNNFKKLENIKFTNLKNASLEGAKIIINNL